MKSTLLHNALLVSSLYPASQLFAANALAQTAAPGSGAEVGVLSKDGSTRTKPGRRGACRGHGGVAKTAGQSVMQ